MNADSKVIVVTGVCGGIGSAVAELLNESGYIVAGFDIDRNDSEVYEHHIVDVTNAEQVKKSLDLVFQKYGKINSLVNCAGILSTNNFYSENYSDWKKILNVNLDSVFICSKEIVDYLIKNEISNIINIASVSAFKQSVFSSVAYCASKAAIVGMSRTMAAQLAKDGVRVNNVAPGFVDTEMIELLSPEVIEKCKNSVPLGRVASPVEVAAAVRYLLSDDASYITGETININGGTFMS
ncbi:MAG: SDR family oxidoreductase [Spirochaetales bacterium]|uniref:SDR family oxidoreductase n=1 Tax=Candidatus Thalassospirochaeta sargassi TaxID=3119039 RepID=A0AAJ1MKT8_9SPIO|nr:SDR family oxidoreductase [Spirochaetales bacterium]